MNGDQDAPAGFHQVMVESASKPLIAQQILILWLSPSMRWRHIAAMGHAMQVKNVIPARQIVWTQEKFVAAGLYILETAAQIMTVTAMTFAKTTFVQFLHALMESARLVPKIVIHAPTTAWMR